MVVKEGVYLHQHGVNPYEGSTFHHVRLRVITPYHWTDLSFSLHYILQHSAQS
jgi:hypothetical protein